MSKCAKATMADELRAMALSWSLKSHAELTSQLTCTEQLAANYIYWSCGCSARGFERCLR